MRHKIKKFHLPPLQKKITLYNNKCSRYRIEVTRPKQPKWGFSSAGRAPALHAGGQEFESPILHHLKSRAERLFFCINNVRSMYMFRQPNFSNLRFNIIQAINPL